MFKSGIVIHYVKEYSKKENEIIFKLIKPRVIDNTLLPRLTAEKNYLTVKNFVKQIC